MSIRFANFLAGLLILAVLLLPAAPVNAQTAAPADLIAAVNALRAGRGLPPYQPDSWLSAFAAQHSEYQAKNNISTHTHSDGSTPWSIGLEENIAAGLNLTPDYAVSVLWADAVHMKTMLDFQTGAIGAGIALGADGTIYYTIDVRPGAPALAAASISGAALQPVNLNQVATPTVAEAPIVAVITATPNPDGSVVHTVAAGQTLWDIAISYGVKIDDIRSLNGLPAGFTDIRTGQSLLIRLPPAQSPTPQVTAKPTARPTRTPLPASATPTDAPPPGPTRTPAPTATHTPIPLLERLPEPKQNNTLGMIIIAVCAIGLVFVLATGFRKE